MANQSPLRPRRLLLQTLAFMTARAVAAPGTGRAVDDGIGSGAARGNGDVEYGQATLPVGIRSRRVDTNNGVVLHLLEAGFEDGHRPCVVLLHGFPELAYSWRHQMLPLAQAGFHVVAPDLRGYGRSVKVPVTLHDDLRPYKLLNRVADVLGLVRALGYEKVAGIVGHDWGGPTAAWCALARPDVFQSVVFMSTPFDGPPDLPLGTADHPLKPVPAPHLARDLANLPRPRKYYRTYLASRAANEDMWHAPQGVHDLLRAQYYFKSGDWPGNRPFPLKSWAAEELAKMPEYYVMDLGKTVAQTMAEKMPSAAEIAACRWMSEADLAVYTAEFTRTGFQGGLNYYRVLMDPGEDNELAAFAGRTIDVPACYIAGAREWGVFQSPGAFEAMQHGACTHLTGVYLLEGAGHSVAEEQPAAVNRLLIDFLRRT